MKYTSSLKLSKEYKRMLGATFDKNRRMIAKELFLNASQSALNKSFIKIDKSPIEKD